MRRSLGLGAALTAVALLTTGCSGPGRIAVRQTADGAVEIIYAYCETPAIVRVEVVGSNGDTMLDEADPRYWRVDFPEPTGERRFVAGTVPPRGQEVTPWRRPGSEDELVAIVTFEGEKETYTHSAEFVPSQIANGRVVFDYKVRSPEDYAKVAPCP